MLRCGAQPFATLGVAIDLAKKEPEVAIDKYESRRIRVEIRRVLLQCWDPIGIREEPNAQDEYDGYLGGVYELLVGGASDKEIADHLGRIVEERMSLHPQGEATERTVRALRAIQIPQQ
jgi:hypothetical protein